MVWAGLIIAARLHVPDNDSSIRREAELIGQRLDGLFELLTGRYLAWGNDEVPKPELPPPSPGIPHHVEDIPLSPLQNFNAFVVLASKHVLAETFSTLCGGDAKALDDHGSGPSTRGQDEFEPSQDSFHLFISCPDGFEQMLRIRKLTRLGHRVRMMDDLVQVRANARVDVAAQASDLACCVVIQHRERCVFTS
jgi:hypothetical protein